jgi:hypothetical protein
MKIKLLTVIGLWFLIAATFIVIILNSGVPLL